LELELKMLRGRAGLVSSKVHLRAR
jgi:hypothetical protein